MESQEWDEWRKTEETGMLEMVETCVYKQVARSKDKLVVGTKMLYKRKIGQDGKVEKYKCRLVAQSRVLAGGRYTLHGKVLAYANDRVNPDAFDDGSGQGRRTAPFRRGAGIFEGGC